jgi:hypothetical protein
VQVVGQLGELDVGVTDNPESIVWKFFATFLGALGYSILSRVPPKMVIHVCLFIYYIFYWIFIFI